jgi:Rrf2 family cysteine metabolism transcriptional repressor
MKAEYALRAIFDLALQKPGKPVRIADIARRQRVPQKFLELILSNLKRGGFVESRRGAEGGYLLARPPDTISVGEVLRFVEGTRGGHQREGRQGESPLAALWSKVDKMASAIVDRVTFSELARAWLEQRDKYAPSWEI